MNTNMIKDLDDLLTIIEKTTIDLGKLSTLSDYDRGKSEGHLEGMKYVASQARAILQNPPKKRLTHNCKVFIHGGPWADHHGTFQGFAHGVMGMQVLILLDGLDLPVEVDEKFIEVE